MHPDSSATHLHLQIFSVLRTLQGICSKCGASTRDPISDATHLFVASWCYGVNATLEPYPLLILRIRCINPTNDRAHSLNFESGILNPEQWWRRLNRFTLINLYATSRDAACHVSTTRRDFYRDIPNFFRHSRPNQTNFPQGKKHTNKGSFKRDTAKIGLPHSL